MIEPEDIVDRVAFARARTQLGPDFARILGYFQADGVKAIAAIEEAMRQHSAAALIMPAHALKSDAAQIGAKPLSLLAEHVELVARRCVESHDAPDELIADVVGLRPLFRATVALLEREGAVPVAPRQPAGFGRRAAPPPAARNA